MVQKNLKKKKKNQANALPTPSSDITHQANPQAGHRIETLFHSNFPANNI